jgi:hypothetical protein
MTGTLKKKPTEYLRQLYFDSIVFTPEALRHLAAETGPGQIIMGTDYPFPWTSTSVDHILNTPGLSDADKVAMLGGTAQRLLGIPAIGDRAPTRPGRRAPRTAGIARAYGITAGRSARRSAAATKAPSASARGKVASTSAPRGKRSR